MKYFEGDVTLLQISIFQEVGRKNELTQNTFYTVKQSS